MRQLSCHLVLETLKGLIFGEKRWDNPQLWVLTANKMLERGFEALGLGECRGFGRFCLSVLGLGFRV